MKLRDKLKEFSSIKEVFIGSKLSFVYAGTVEEAFEDLSKIEIYYLESYKNYLKVNENILINYPIRIAEIKELLPTKELLLKQAKKQQIEYENIFNGLKRKTKAAREEKVKYAIQVKKAEEIVKRLTNEMAEKEKKLSTAPNRIAMYKGYIDNYKPFLDREVKESYPRLLEAWQTNIIVDGPEQGQIWLYEEYPEFYKKVVEVIEKTRNAESKE